jgi:DNA adenine methylase
MFPMGTNPSDGVMPWSPPLLRWAGSKRRLIPLLLSLRPAEIKRYIEPFGGSACLLFALRPRRAILGDINEALTEAYATIRDHPRLVARRAHSWPKTSGFYYALRSQSPPQDPIERAARFVYLNRYCFNGVYRVNRNGSFNVPRGVHTGTLPSEGHFYRCAVALRDVRLVAGDFERCLASVRSGDFVYLDPPYAVGRRRTHGEYGYDSFQATDVPRLVKSLRQIDLSGATFLLSYAYQRSLSKLWGKWHYRRISVQRHVAGFAVDRRRVYEVLVSNRPI